MTHPPPANPSVPPPKTVHSSFRQAIHPGRAAVVGAGYILAKTAGCHNRDFPHYALVYLLEGGGIYEDPIHGKRNVRQGDAICVFPHRLHSYYGVPGLIWSECFLVFQGKLFETLEADGLFDPREPVLTPGVRPELIDHLKQIYDRFQAVQSPHDPALVAETHLLIARARACHDQAAAEAGGRRAATGDRAPNHRNTAEHFLARSCLILETNLAEDLDLEPVARGFNLSYERFRKRFTQAAGLPPARYRLLRRIDRAKALLLETDLSIKEIAAQLGFCDPFFFSRQFKQVAGRTPSDFRTSM
ncbi:MAG TPA: AraC family transcriptional regulator [Planctomycetota bacterium]|nr:AraC family transcriptional regulator [Planctomycetota bacterium]